MILKRKSEKLPRKGKATHMKDLQMSMDFHILARGVQTEDIGGGIGRSIEILILDGKKDYTQVLYPCNPIFIKNRSSLYIAEGHPFEVTAIGYTQF